MEEKKSVSPTDQQAGSLLSYSGWSSSDFERERNLEDDEDRTRLITGKSYAMITVTHGLRHLLQTLYLSEIVFQYFDREIFPQVHYFRSKCEL
jgi:hypothetical protein